MPADPYVVVTADAEESSSSSRRVSFKTYHRSFEAILGPSPSITLLHQDPDGISTYHEACVYHQPTHSVFITSNQIPLPSGQTHAATANKTVQISRIYDHHDPAQIQIDDATPTDLPEGMWNGGVNYKSGLLYCAQGSKKTPGGLTYVADPSPPYKTEVLISSFHGRQFNSVNDVIIHPEDGSIWFTDPTYGFHQGIRPDPVLPCQVYRFEPSTGDIRAVADGFTRPNGLCFSPHLDTLYITDTGAIHGNRAMGIDPQGPSHIYAFTVARLDGAGPFLTDRRLFAYADGGWPDGIKCDIEGNVYSGCGDGVEVWNTGGVLIGKILVQGGVANFCFGKEGTVYMCNETRVWRAQLAKGGKVKGALLGL